LPLQDSHYGGNHPEKIKMRALTFLLLSILSYTVGAEERADLLVREDFFAAVLQNDRVRFEKGMQRANDFLAKEPNNAQMMVWQGVGLFMSARYAFENGDYQKGQALQQQGLSRMQQAVDLAPDDPNVLVARGAALINSSRYMPEQAGRPLVKLGVSDYEATLKIQQPIFGELSSHSKGELLLGLADGWIRSGDLDKARHHFETMASDPTLKDSVYESKARAWLDGKPESKTREFFQCSGCHKVTAD
jgi:hypothetical protein